MDLYFRSFLLFILGAIHLLFSLWMVIEYFVVNYPNFILPLPSFFYTLFQRSVHCDPQCTCTCVYTGQCRFRLKKPERTYSSINIYGLRTLYVILFLSASILSLAFYGYFYALCLLHIVINNDILQRVLRSVTKNGTSCYLCIYTSHHLYNGRYCIAVGGCFGRCDLVHIFRHHICLPS